ncbi:hypothetical protein CHS0354_006888 [Potamilus streckersoni]|uniref:Cytochrome C biogenesis protein n=1 Tax=Potamilus streckersoni TaxID=2493646 RepID=A0AAE0TEC8_9BIVA|nr:hypothetical protein CHS0354_006888 [Potamilus streckersoni]
MVNDIAYFALFGALIFSCLAFFSGIFGIRINSGNVISASAKMSVVTAGLIILSFLGLIYGFITDDFSVSFVKGHSSVDLPWFYKITAAWGGMDGSLMFWATLQGAFMAYIYYIYRNRCKDVFPYAMLVLTFIQMFLLFLLVGWSNPLSRIYPIPADGSGLNPLLQHWGMIIHPPILYTGFILLSIPFAFGIGSLIAGKFDNDWIMFTRRWTLMAWLFLTFGMFLGGQWAYYELGWGGYWAWDPVENSSLMPWLAGTAFLHSVIVQEKRNILKTWNLILITLGFVLTILGTFITRSGLLNSVHAFAQSNIGPAFLVFIALTIVVSFGLIIYRLPMLDSKTDNAAFLSKENAFLLNNIVFTGICFGVFYGTVFPLIAEGLFDKKLSIQAPYFNRINFPIALGLIILMAAAPFVAWRKGSPQKLRRALLPIGGISVLISVFAYFFIMPRWEVVILSGVLYFAFHAVLLELTKTVSARLSISRRENIPITARYLFKDRRRWGSLIVHLGVIVAFLGFMGNFFASEKSVTLKPGEAIDIGSYHILYREPVEFKKLNALHLGGVFEVYSEGELKTTLMPTKANYPTGKEPTTEVAIYRTFSEDLYLSPASLNNDESITLTVYINPMIIFVQLSAEDAAACLNTDHEQFAG